jgi:hypothetical protein
LGTATELLCIVGCRRRHGCVVCGGDWRFAATTPFGLVTAWIDGDVRSSGELGCRWRSSERCGAWVWAERAESHGPVVMVEEIDAEA